MNAPAPVKTPGSTPVDRSKGRITILTPQEAEERKSAAQGAPRDKSHAQKSDDYYTKDELAEAIRASLRTNEFFTDRFNSFWNALGREFNDFDVKKTAPSIQGGKRIQLDMPALVHTAVQNMKVVKSDAETGALFSSRNGHIQVKNGEIQFIADTDPRRSSAKRTVQKKLTYEDAYNAIVIASMNKEMIHPNRLLIEGGTRADRLMYMRAVKAYNATVPQELQFRTNLAAISMAPVTSANKNFGKYMHRAADYASQAPGKTDTADAPLPTSEDVAEFNGKKGSAPAKDTTEAKPDQLPAAPRDKTPDSSPSSDDWAAFNGETGQPAAKDATEEPTAQPRQVPASTGDKASPGYDWGSFNDEESSVSVEKTPEPAAASKYTHVELAAHVARKGSAIESYIDQHSKEILKQPPVDMTGGTPARNVYLVHMEGFPNDRTYCAKIGGKLSLIYTKDDVVELRDDNIYLQNDMGHPKHPLHRSAQMVKEFPGQTAITDLSSFTIAAVLPPVEFKGWDEFQTSFHSAAAVERRTKAAVRTAQKLDDQHAGPKPGSGTMG